MSLLELFCAVDDFCRQWEPVWQQQQLSRGLRRRQRIRQLYLSEIMTILIAFHCSGYRNFKTYFGNRCAATGAPSFLVWSVTRALSSSCPRLCCPCVPICAVVWVPALAFRSWIPRRWPSATTIGLRNTRCLRAWRTGARVPPAGSLASNCICCSTTGANC